MRLSYRHFERSEKSFSIAVHQSMIGNRKRETGNPPTFWHRPIYIRGASLFYAPHHHFSFLISNFAFKRSFQTQSRDGTSHKLTLNPEPFHNTYSKNTKETIACIFF